MGATRTKDAGAWAALVAVAVASLPAPVVVADLDAKDLCVAHEDYAWVDQFGTSGNELGRDVAVDAAGNAFITGYTTGTFPGMKSAGGWDAFLVKFTPGGTLEWLTQFGVSTDDRGLGVAIDSLGNQYVAGVTLGEFPGERFTGGGSDAFLAKFDPRGRQLWVRQFGAGKSDQGYRVVVDSDDDVYVSGSTLGVFPGQQTANDDRDAFLIKHTADGEQLWVRQFGTEGGDSGPALAVDHAGYVYVGGYTTDALPGQHFAGEVDAFLVKYSSDGTPIWSRQFGTDAATIATDLAVDTAGNVYVAGHTGGAFPSQQNAGTIDAFLAKYNPGGTLLWVRQFGTSAIDRAYGVDVDHTGHLLVTGNTDGVFPGEQSAGGTDNFYAKFTPEGDQLWVRQFGTSGHDFNRAVAVDESGNAYIGGRTLGAFPGQQSAGNLDAFLARWDGCDPFVSEPGGENPPTQPNVHIPPFANERHLIFLTHGCCTSNEMFAEHWAPWASELAMGISTLGSWLVYVHDWSPSPDSSASVKHAIEEARVLGPKIASQQYDHVHLIAHGIGSAMITKIACHLEAHSPNTSVHLTYLDAQAGVIDVSSLQCAAPGAAIQPLHELYGTAALWSDHYRASDPCWTAHQTGMKLPNAHNINVTALDPAYHKLCESSHNWPPCFYRYSVSGNAQPCSGEALDSQDFLPFGFGMSKAKQGLAWQNAVMPYQLGESVRLPEGGPDSSSDEAIGPVYRVRLDDAIDLSALDAFTAPTGTVSIEGAALSAQGASTGEPVWVNLLLETGLATNFLRFDVVFTSEADASGLLTAYLNGQSIGYLNEQTAPEGVLSDLMMYADVEPGQHVLSFRLDNFSEPPASVTIENVATGWAAFVNIADLNVDGVVDVFDLIILINEWGPCDDPDDCHADLNGDGVVDVFDLVKLISNWG